VLPTWTIWLVIALLLLVRGLFAALEAALHSLSDSKLEVMAKEGSRRAKRLIRLKNESELTWAAIRSGMVLSGFTAAALGVLVPPRLLDLSILSFLQASALTIVTPLISALLVAALAITVDVLFRSAAGNAPETWALRLSALALIVVRVLTPFVKLLAIPLNLILAPFGQKVAFEPPPAPLEELEKQLIHQAQNHEVDKGAPALIRSIFELSDKTCRDVMVPRTEVVAIELSKPIEEVLQLIAEENHSRLPVYKDDIDKIVGVLHVRDIVPMMKEPDLIVLSDVLRPAVYVPWVKPVGDLLREMQKQKIHMAVVVDEYGGFSGIVTLEDILREIVGDIGDEFDEPLAGFEKQADDTFLVDATLQLGEFEKNFDFKFPDGEFETLGGFLSHLAGAIPEVGDRFMHSNWSFTVHSKAGPRLERVRVARPRFIPGERRPSYESLAAVEGRQ
jgi:putative hemolysin